MKFKALTLALLLTVQATQTICAQQETQLNLTLEDEYGIDLRRLYSGWEVTELLQIATEEAETAIEKAFNEGYKQGVLEHAPEAKHQEILALNLGAELKQEKKLRWIFAACGLAGGLVIGTVGILAAVRN